MRKTVDLPRRTALVAGTAWALTACSSQDSGQDDAAQATAPATVQATPAAELDHTSPDSLYVIVNKHNPMQPENWMPDDLVAFGNVSLRAEAAEAATKMFEAGEAAGLTLTTLSGFRSYETQISTYDNWVATYGQEQADTASARPGYSEHQSGLALDIGNNAGCDVDVCFADTAEAKWMAEHCHEYGFILRFPWNQHEVTGYWYESWHFRYIGLEQAQAYKQSGAENLETFWGYEAAATYKD